MGSYVRWRKVRPGMIEQRFPPHITVSPSLSHYSTCHLSSPWRPTDLIYINVTEIYAETKLISPMGNNRVDVSMK